MSAAGVTAAGVAVLTVMVVAVGVQLWSLGRFQEELRREGFVILDDPLAVCIGGCHAPTRPGPRDPFNDPRFEGPRLIPERPFPDPRLFPDLGPRPAPSPEPDREQRRCQEANTGALACTDASTRETVVRGFLERTGHDPDSLLGCKHKKSDGPDVIDACSGAPSETWHCDVKGVKAPVSVFGCLCCKKDGSTDWEWRAPHWSAGGTGRVGPGRRRRP